MVVTKTYWQYCIVAALAVAVFCYWLLLFPYIPVVREASQLFLWTGDYFTERIVTPGGLARYLGEMIGQCFINPVNGAIAYAVLFVLAQLLSGKLLRQLFPTMKTAYRFVLSLVVPIALWILGMVPSIPLTLTVAVIMVLGAGCAIMALPSSKRLWVLLPTIAVVYWLAGTDFYDYDEEVGKEMGTYEEMECDLLLRQGEWHEIIRRFPQPESPAVRSAVLLAYHKAGQMDKQELMNNLVIPSEQQGSSLSVFNISDTHFVVNFGSLSSAFIASDLAYQLYWINIAQRAAFEAMEYVPSCNKSGRALKRLVETNIISGHYDVARKYIAILEKTTFYSGWAQKMRQLVDHPEQIVNYPFLHSAQKEYENTTDIFFI
jgi:hypothetical protein